MALYVIVFIGTTPIGGPIVGWVAQTYGARAGLALGGVATLVAAAIVLWALGHWRVGLVDRVSSQQPAAQNSGSPQTAFPMKS